MVINFQLGLKNICSCTLKSFISLWNLIILFKNDGACYVLNCYNPLKLDVLTESSLTVTPFYDFTMLETATGFLYLFRIKKFKINAE